MVSLKTWFIEEPRIMLGNNNLSVDPKIGIISYGPYTLGIPSTIRIGIIGDGESISYARGWLEELKSPIEGKEGNFYLFPPFWGFNEESTFRCEIVIDDSIIEKMDNKKIEEVIKEVDVNKRISKGVQLFLKKIKILSERDPKPDIIVCALPKKIDEYCGISQKTYGAKRPKYTKLEKKIEYLKSIGQKFILEYLEEFEEDRIGEQISFDFRRSLKGRSMKYGIPIQIVRWRTLIDAPGLEDKATRAWNFSLAIYYKGGGIPWKIADLDENTCFVGISFYRNKLNPDENIMVSVSQIFTIKGQSFVLKGEKVTKETEDRIPHLASNSAYNLLKKSLLLYKEHIGVFPQRVVVHKTSKYNEGELKGFKRVLDELDIGNYSLVGFDTQNVTGIFFLRNQRKYPPIRGTLIQLPDNSFLLYTAGFVPYLETYPGPKIPKPIRILEIYGYNDITLIAKEILALTKLNWNSTKFYSKEPVTIRFSREVGKILSELPEDIEIQPYYKFYM